MIDTNIWYKAEDQYDRDVYFYNYFVKLEYDGIVYYSVGVRHPTYKTFIDLVEQDYEEMDELLDNYDFSIVSEKNIIKDLFS